MNLLKREYSELLTKFHTETEVYEDKQNSYFKNMYSMNKRTGEVFQMFSSSRNWFKNQSSLTLQRVMYIKTLSRKRGLKPIFVTFTVPSQYHPFRTYKRGGNYTNWDINKKFTFNTIEESMRESYSLLNEIWRDFYIKVKKGKREFYKDAKDILFIQSLEFHKSFIPHSHSLLYVPESMISYIQECYEKVIKEFKLNKKSNDFKSDFNKYKYSEGYDEIDGSSNYITKYIIKNLEDNQKSFSDFEKIMFGWKRNLGNKVRLFKSSNIGMSVEVYKKVYYNLTEDLKE